MIRLSCHLSFVKSSGLTQLSPQRSRSCAGAASRQSLGTAVFGKMVVSTVLNLFIVPVFYIVISTLFCNFKNDCQSLSPEKQQAKETKRETVAVGNVRR